MLCLGLYFFERPALFSGKGGESDGEKERVWRGAWYQDILYERRKKKKTENVNGDEKTGYLKGS